MPLKNILHTYTRSPRISAVAAIVVLLVMMLMIRTPRMETRIDDLNIEGNPYALSGAKMAETFGSKNIIQVVVQPATQNMQSFFEAMDEVKMDLMSTFPGIRVETLNRALPLIYRQVGREATVQEALKAAQQIPVARTLISSDQSSVLIVAFADRAEQFNPARFDSVVDIPRPSLKVEAVVSQSHIEQEVENALIRDYLMMFPVIAAIYIVFLFFTYKSISAIIFCLLNMGLAFIPILFFITLFGVNINQVTAPSMPVVIILSLSASVHLITGYRTRINNSNLTDPLADTIHHYLVPTFLSVLTTSISFGSFYLSDSLYIRQFGMVAACSLLIVFLITFLLAPITLRLVKFSRHTVTSGGFIQKTEGFLNHFRKPITVALFTVTAISVFYINDITFRTNIENFIPINSRIHKGVEILNNQFHSIASLDIMAERDLDRADSIPAGNIRKDLLDVVAGITEELMAIPGVVAVESVHDQLEFENRFFMPGLRGAIYPRSNNPFVSQDQLKYRIHVKLADPDQIQAVKKHLSTITASYASHYTFSIYSDYLYFEFISTGITRSLLRSLLVSALLIIMIILLMTMSIQKTLISILVNSIPLGFMVLILVLFKVEMNITTSLSLVLCLGLIVDDTIQILYRRARLAEPMGELGFGILTTSIVVTGGFLSFLLSSSLPTRVFGLICAAVFIIAAISDMTVMPWMFKDKGE
jgi:uncharacterized protein